MTNLENTNSSSAFQLGSEVALGIEYVLHEAVGPHGRHVGDSHGRGNRVATEGGAVHVGAHFGVEDLVDQWPPDHEAPEWLVRRGDALGEGDHVGHHAKSLAGKPVAEAAK